MIVIGIGHKSRQGKNELAKYLVSQFIKKGYYAKQYAFADALKAYCRVAFQMYTKDPTLLQMVGTDIFRNKIDRDVWVDILSAQINEESPAIAIVSDMRFKNEADFVNDCAGFTINITGRPTTTDRDNNHASEVELDNYEYDYVIDNSGTLLNLYIEANNIIADILSEV